MSLPRLWNTKSFFELMLPALTTMFGLHMLRVLLPSIVWYLGDTLDASNAILGLAAIGVFALSFLVTPFYRSLGLRRALFSTLVGIAIMRLLEQVTLVPALDLVFALGGVVLFTFFIPLYLSFVRVQGGAAPRKFGRGLLLGFVFDTTLRGSFNTLDVS